jgi:hypothetical protein
MSAEEVAAQDTETIAEEVIADAVEAIFSADYVVETKLGAVGSSVMRY